jgi:uncharacterized protein (UPF0261 family)
LLSGIELTPIACDMVNFGPRSSVPERYNSRNLFQHNPSVTLMRTSVENCHQIGKFIASQLRNGVPSKTHVLLPTLGVSAIDAPGQPFHDLAADEALFEALEKGLEGTGIEVTRVDVHVNDEEFAKAVVKVLVEMLEGDDPRTYRLANARRRKWSFDHGKSITGFVRRPSQGGELGVVEGD